MTWLAPLGIIVAIVLIIYLAMKGYSILIIGPICALVVIFTNQMDVFKFLITGPSSYMMGLAKFVSSFFIIFLLGSILAKYIEESGAARSIANFVLKVTGKKNPYSVLIAIFLISSILTYGGVSLYVILFAIIPLSKPIFKEINISWNLIVIPIVLGVGTFTMTMLPGTPSIQNVIPTTYLGTTLTAAPLLGIIATVVVIVYGLWYMKRIVNKSLSKGETYNMPDADSKNEIIDDSKLPNIGLSVAPILILILIIFIGSFMKIPNIIVIALLVSVLVSMVLLGRYTKSQKDVINAGAQGSISPVLFTAATVGFGTVISVAPGFKTISAAILNIPGSPLISLSFATSLLSLVTGSASGSIGIVMESFAKNYLAMGINPDVIHRIAAISSGGFSAMPHSGVMLVLLMLTGLKHKDCYKYVFMTMVVGSTIATVVAVAAAIVLY